MNKKISHTAVALSLLIFLGFSFFHVGQFETSDEVFWKNQRIPAYWHGLHNGITEGEWKRVNINDKPGVSLALISGIGLPFLEQSPLSQRDRAAEKQYDKAFKMYDTTQTERINTALRTPLILFTAILLGLTFLLLRSLFSLPVATVTTLLLTLSPATVGLAQILNPDSLLWVFSFLGLISFYGLLTTQKKKYFFITCLSCGFALLSKYTANILFILFALLTFFYAAVHYAKDQRSEIRIVMRRSFLSIAGIMALSYAIYAFFFPVVFTQEASFLAGTLLSPTFLPLYPWILFLLGAIIIDFFAFKSFVALALLSFVHKYYQLFARCIVGAVLIFFLLAIINALGDAFFIPLDDLKERIDVGKSLKFDSVIGDTLPAIYLLKELLIESFGIIFALPSVVLGLLILTWTHIIIRGLHYHKALLPFLSIILFLFLLGGLLAEVFVTLRYAIIPYAALLLVAALGSDEMIRVTLLPWLKKRWPRSTASHVWCVFIATLFCAHIYSLQSIAPHYLNYHNSFLPKKYVVTDSWSYGVYEAAQHLNSLPGAKDIVVWTDRGALCRYFIGKCTTRSAIDRENIVPDYFLVTRRNVMRPKHFSWKDPAFATIPAEEYYSGTSFDQPFWELPIGGREKNYIKLIESHEEK